MKKVKQTHQTIKKIIIKSLTILIAVAIGLVGMSLLHFITLPDVVTRFVGYLLIITSVYYTFCKLK